MSGSLLPTPGPGDEVAWVRHHLGHLCADDPVASPRVRGTQAAADAALAAFDVHGYAARRNEVLPAARRGASGLSPWIRHGMLSLPEVWAAVEGGPRRDVEKFRDELLWQEYARHLYARMGGATRRPLRFVPDERSTTAEPWDTSMACMAQCREELERDGWLVNQTRMWMASQWTVRHGRAWQEGEDRFFTHLLDGSRAANRLGWQWTVGAGTGSPYGFSQWQVRKRAPGLCATCALEHRCPIAAWPDTPERLPAVEERDRSPLVDRDPDVQATAGPRQPEFRAGGAHVDAVWITAESLGERDPALAAQPGAPALFVFDEPLLAGLRVSGKRLVFLAERLAELAADRPVQVHLGAPAQLLADAVVAATFTPVPGWRRIARELQPAVVHPWPWLRRPGAGSVRSFSAWRGR